MKRDDIGYFPKPLTETGKFLVENSVQYNFIQSACLDKKQLFDFAFSHEMASTIAFNLAQKSSWEAVPQVWQQVYDEVDALIRSYLDELDQVSAWLAQEAIQLVALKNSGIVRGIYPHPGAVPMGDVDVLVRKGDFRQAHAILLAHEYQFEFRSDLEEEDLDEAEQGGGAEYWKLLPNGEKLWFELQWRPVAGRWIRPDQEPSADELMDRSIPIEGTSVRLLAPEDNLSAHPQIFMPLKKEPQFFTANWGKGFDWYTHWFDTQTTETAIGESSMTYTYPAYATVAPERIASHLPDVRLIYLLRNPVERTFSHYNYYRYYSKVEKLDFAQAIAEWDIYLGTSLYFEWIERYLSYFAQEKLLVVLFEEMVDNPAKELSQIFSFLDVDPTFVPPHAETKTNATFKARNEAVFNLYRRFSLSRSRMWMESLIPEKARPVLRNQIRGILGGQEKPPALSTDMEQYLGTYFEPEIQRLESFLGRSLAVWRQGNVISGK